MDDIGEGLGLGRIRKLFDAIVHLGVDVAVGSGAGSPDFSDLYDVLTAVVRGDAPHDALTDGQLAEADEGTEKWFTRAGDPVRAGSSS